MAKVMLGSLMHEQVGCAQTASGSNSLLRARRLMHPEQRS
jgi:hypothetical protein